MKKLLLLLLPFAIVHCAQAQITFTTSDIPVVPATLTAAVDTLPTGITPGANGANATWNFSNIVQHITETTTHKTAAQAGYGTQFPSATNAVTTDNAKYGFFKNSSSAYTAQGLAGDLLNTGSSIDVTFSPTLDAYRFPTTYGNNFGGNYGFTKTVSGSSINQPVYQARATFTAQYFDTIDAWGACTTPLGTYSTLRQKHKEFTHTVVEYQLTPISSWTNLSDTYDTTLVYNWLAKETKGAVVSLTVNKQGAVSRASYSLTPPTPIANFTYVVNGGGVAQFTNTSTNSPSSYSWTFGDGGTSISTNPSHTYTASNTYNVCLTATNSSGSNTKCENVPVAINVAAPFHAAITGPVQPCINHSTGLTYSDSSRAGNNYTWSVVGGSITAGNGTNAVTVDWSGTGGHSIKLIECNSGSTFCDTVTLAVTINPALTTNLSQTICSGSSYTFNGVSLSAAGTYHDTLTASTGCDSIVTLTLNVTPTTNDSLVMLYQISGYNPDNIFFSESIIGTSQHPLDRAVGVSHFTAQPVNAGSSPTFIWMINGQVVGTNADTFSMALQSGDIVSCTVIASGTCFANDTIVATYPYAVALVGINETALDQSISVFPNPNGGHFTVGINQFSQQLKVELLNIQGQTLYTEQLKDQPSYKKELNFADLAKGIYLLKVSTENGVAVKRVVVE